MKICPGCQAIIAAGYLKCPDCGHVFPDRVRKPHEPFATSEGILSDQIKRVEHHVSEVRYAVHQKRAVGDDAPRSMRVDYHIALKQIVSEWVCFEHQGYARLKAEEWWRRRSDEPVPDTAEQAVEMAEHGALAATLAITILRRPGDKFDRIVAYRLGEKPALAAEEAPF